MIQLICVAETTSRFASDPNFLSHFYCVLHLFQDFSTMPNEGDFNESGYFQIPTGIANKLEETLSEDSTESEYGIS